MILVVFLQEAQSLEDGLDDRLIKSSFLDRSMGEHSFLTSAISITQSEERALFCAPTESPIESVRPISFVPLTSRLLLPAACHSYSQRKESGIESSWRMSDGFHYWVHAKQGEPKEGAEHRQGVLLQKAVQDIAVPALAECGDAFHPSGAVYQRQCG